MGDGDGQPVGLAVPGDEVHGTGVARPLLVFDVRRRDRGLSRAGQSEDEEQEGGGEAGCARVIRPFNNTPRGLSCALSARRAAGG